MLYRRFPISGAVTWAMVALSLWIGWPSTGCVCSDGGYRWFCPSRQPMSASAPTVQTGHASVACCSRAADVARRSVSPGNCCEASPCPSHRASGPGCHPVAKAAFVVPAPAAQLVSPDQSVALYALPHDPVPLEVAFAVEQSPIIDTGPPVDLVIALHCLLI